MPLKMSIVAKLNMADGHLIYAEAETVAGLFKSRLEQLLKDHPDYLLFVEPVIEVKVVTEECIERLAIV